MTSVLPLTLGQSSVNFDNSSATGIITINGTSLTEIDASNIPPVRSLTWNNLYNLRDNLGAVQNAPNTTTLRVENTLRLTDNLGNTRNISTLANPATTIDTTSDNTSGTYYLPFTKSTAGTNQQLFVDDSGVGAGPLTYNPSTSTLNAAIFSGTSTSVNTTGNNGISAMRRIAILANTSGGSNTVIFDAGATLPFSYQIDVQALQARYLSLNNTLDSSGITFNSGTGALTVPVGNALYSTYNWTYSHTSSANISSLVLSNFRAGGYYTLFFTNNSGVSMNWNTGLGANILVNYSSARALANGEKAMVRILFDGTSYYIDYGRFIP